MKNLSIATKLLFLKWKYNVNNKENTNLLSIDNWKNCKTYKFYTKTESQLDYYVRMNACSYITKIVALDSKRFGTISEKIICEIFNFEPRTSCQNDAVFNNKKIEIKSARYWESKDECKWQHIEIYNEFDYILFVLLDFNGWKIWCLSKEKLLNTKELYDKKIVTKQGKQGYWTKKSLILPYLIEIKTIDDLESNII